jgi:hypothetical protein
MKDINLLNDKVEIVFSENQMDYIQMSVPDPKRSSIMLRHFKKINLLLTTIWAD